MAKYIRIVKASCITSSCREDVILDAIKFHSNRRDTKIDTNFFLVKSFCFYSSNKLACRRGNENWVTLLELD